MNAVKYQARLTDGKIVSKSADAGVEFVLKEGKPDRITVEE